MATVDDILTGYTMTESQLNDAFEVNKEAQRRGMEAKVDKKETVPTGANIDIDPSKVSRPKMDGDEKQPRPSIDERMAQWVKANPAPVQKAVPEPEYKQTFNYQDILDQYKKAEEVDPKLAKRQKINQSIGAVGDALTSLVNATGVSNGANNMQLDPSNGMAENIRKRYEETREKQKGDREKYLNLMLKAAGLEDADNMKKYSLYQQALNNADRDYNSKLNAWNRAYDQQADGYRYEDKLEDEAAAKAEAAKTSEKRQAETERHNKVVEGQGAARLAETRRHNSAVENNNSNSGNGGSGSGKTAPQQFGNYRCGKAKSAEELKNIAEEMRHRGCFDARTANKVKRGEVDAGVAIQRALEGGNASAAARVLQNHGFNKVN